MFIGGEWVDARSGETFETVDPFTGRVWAEIPEAGPEDVDAAVRAARAAFDDGPWPRLTGTERARLMRRLADLIAERAEEIAVVETTDNGKLIREMEGQLRGLADYYHWFAGAADKIHGETIPADRTNFLDLHAEGAGRGRRGDHPVELAGPAHELEARAGARRRVHVRRQARRAGAGLDARVRAAGRGGRLPARRLQRRHRLRPRPARRSSPTRASTRSPSRAPRRPASS